MVGAVARRAVTVPIGALDPRQESIQGCHEVLVRACPDLDYDEPGGRMRHEDREEPVTLADDLSDERGTRGRQVVQTPAAPRPDRELARLYGKMLRIASRIRPSPPPIGADS